MASIEVDRIFGLDLEIMYGFMALLGLVASIVAGVLWDHVGHAAVFLYGAAFALAGTVALVALIPARSTRHF